MSSARSPNEAIDVFVDALAAIVHADNEPALSDEQRELLIDVIERSLAVALTPGAPGPRGGRRLRRVA